jgi:hypothetical protein
MDWLFVTPKKLNILMERQMKRTVLVICDGLRADMVRPDLTPNLCRIGVDSRVFQDHNSVFPSTTRTTAASIATGCLPKHHGLEGNCVALDDGDGLQAYSVGPPEFRDKLRAVTGRTLLRPTLSERLKDHGGGVVYSNVSAGAAYFHDPDGFGTIYHRLGSYGPGLNPITDERHQETSHDSAGDAALTERFCVEALGSQMNAYSLLWMCDPDHTQHEVSLGSPRHVQSIADADTCAGRVYDRIKQLNAAGEDILFLVGSDHGHETVGSVLDLNALLVEAGLKENATSSDVVVASNGLSANIYLSSEAWERLPNIIPFLRSLDDIDQVFAGTNLARLGHRTDTALAVAVTTKGTNEVNEFGVPGISIAVQDPLHADTRMGCGQHGGLGPNEQNPFLMAHGGEFGPGTRDSKRSSAIDLAPTVLRHLGQDWDGMDGVPLDQS